jgi:hypothetical protein
MSWLFSRALVEACSGGCSSGGAPSAPSSATPTPQAFCAPDRMTAFCRASRFGMTFGPLTEDRGEDLLMSFRAAFPARTSVAREEGPACQESGVASGGKCTASLARYDPDTRGWKTAQQSLFGGYETFTERWPDWDTMRSGELYRLPTPSSITAIRERRRSITNASGDGCCLPTMRKRDWKDSGTVPPSRRADPGKDTLGQALARQLATLTASDMGSAGRGQNKQGGDNLRTQVGGPLSPTWCEWFMGFPLGWTALAPLATHRFRQWLRSHGMCCTDD